ncbi:hypothetical protein ACFWY9_13870 [Amycolatopsis sp. NPDC059027]|uniref:hypothetical protein n=1 Tax=unclassified Amycolatopsis TaxID=2618356 RepID=UPI003670CC90
MGGPVELRSVLMLPGAVVVVCVLALLVLCLCVVFRDGSEGLKHVAEVLRALRRPRRRR